MQVSWFLTQARMEKAQIIGNKKLLTVSVDNFVRNPFIRGGNQRRQKPDAVEKKNALF